LDTSRSTPGKENREYSRRLRETYNQKESEREKKNKINEKEKKNNYYDSYDQREGEIRKEDWGIALKSVSIENINKTDMTTQRVYRIDEESIPRSIGQNRGEVTEVYSDRDQTIELCAKLVKFMQKDNDLRGLIYAMLEGPWRVDPNIRRFEDKEVEETIKKVERRKREEEMEEEKIRQKQLVDRIKKRYDGKLPTVNPRNEKWII